LVTGNKDYNEVDYRAWSPWTKDKQLSPAPSLDEPHRFSHPVHQYDEPVVSVVIPVGPGHVKYLANTLDCLDAQIYKKWEAIVVFDVSSEEWVELQNDGTLRHLAKAWPFCRFATTTGSGGDVRNYFDMLDIYEVNAFHSPDYENHLLSLVPADGPHGAGKARNVGIRLARGPLLLFLDADDWIVPDALKKMVGAYRISEKAIFTDHMAIADIAEEDLGRVDGKVMAYNHSTGQAYIYQKVADYDCERAMEQPYTDGRPPYVICNVTTLIPKRWIVKAGGFDEDMESWEDVLLFWKVAWAGRCFERLPEALLVYRYSTGKRRDHGFRERRGLLEYLKKESEGAEKMGCNCRGGKKTNRAMEVMESMVTRGGSKDVVQMKLSRGGFIAVQDSDLVLVRFESEQKGDQARYGLHDFGGGFINYGHRTGDGTEEFLVHQLDIEADVGISQAHGRMPMFTPISSMSIEPSPEEVEVEDLAPPELVEEEEDESPGYIGVEAMEIKDAVSEEDVLLEDLDLGTSSPLMLQYIALLKRNNIHTATDVIAYERMYPDEKGIARIEGIGKKMRKRFVSASNKVVLGHE